MTKVSLLRLQLLPHLSLPRGSRKVCHQRSSEPNYELRGLLECSAISALGSICAAYLPSASPSARK